MPAVSFLEVALRRLPLSFARSGRRRNRALHSVGVGFLLRAAADGCAATTDLDRTVAFFLRDLDLFFTLPYWSSAPCTISTAELGENSVISIAEVGIEPHRFITRRISTSVSPAPAPRRDHPVS
jgi:hypothetical protein